MTNEERARLIAGKRHGLAEAIRQNLDAVRADERRRIWKNIDSYLGELQQMVWESDSQVTHDEIHADLRRICGVEEGGDGE